jgi:hypothetical protein
MANNKLYEGKTFSFVSRGDKDYTAGDLYVNGAIHGVVVNTVTQATVADTTATATQKTVVVDQFGVYELTVVELNTPAIGGYAYHSLLEPTKVTTAESSVNIIGCFVGTKSSANKVAVDLRKAGGKA